jgi:hypothetical protein
MGLQISAVSMPVTHQPSQAAATSKQAAVRATIAASAQKKDGDGDHGIEPQGAGQVGAKTGQLLNALA